MSGSFQTSEPVLSTSGGVVGTAGFIEFVAVSGKHGMLTLLVASDD